VELYWSSCVTCDLTVCVRVCVCVCVCGGGCVCGGVCVGGVCGLCGMGCVCQVVHGVSIVEIQCCMFLFCDVSNVSV